MWAAEQDDAVLRGECDRSAAGPVVVAAHGLKLDRVCDDPSGLALVGQNQAGRRSEVQRVGPQFDPGTVITG